MIYLDRILFMIFIYLPPISLVLSICFFITSLILKYKDMNFKKFLIAGIILLAIVILAFIGVIIMGIVGVGPGRFN